MDARLALAWHVSTGVDWKHFIARSYLLCSGKRYLGPRHITMCYEYTLGGCGQTQKRIPDLVVLEFRIRR